MVSPQRKMCVFVHYSSFLHANAILPLSYMFLTLSLLQGFTLHNTVSYTLSFITYMYAISNPSRESYVFGVSHTKLVACNSMFKSGLARYLLTSFYV